MRKLHLCLFAAYHLLLDLITTHPHHCSVIYKPGDVPLSANMKQCHQSSNLHDNGWECYNNENGGGHVLCGHEGVVTLLSSEYEVAETGENGTGTLRITAVRTGGGVGKISFCYSIEHIGTDYRDVSLLHSPWSSKRTIVMEDGVTRISWLLSINDDAETEGDEVREQFSEMEALSKDLHATIQPTTLAFLMARSIY
eukprot:349108_1